MSVETTKGAVILLRQPASKSCPEPFLRFDKSTSDFGTLSDGKGSCIESFGEYSDPSLNDLAVWCKGVLLLINGEIAKEADSG